MLRPLRGWRELRALGASGLAAVRRVSERGLTQMEDEGEKEVTVYKESHFEGRKEGEKERTERGVNFLYEERLLGKGSLLRVPRFLRLL